MTLDINFLYLNTPLARCEYLWLKLINFHDDVIKEYHLKKKTTKDGFVYVEVRKGMYALPQTGLLAHILLEEQLQKHGYKQSKLTVGFWKHKGGPICFTLVVENFGLNYIRKEHSRHLVSVLKEHYGISEDWEAKQIVGLTFDWDYEKRRVHMSMLGYVNHGTSWQAQDQPYQHTVPTYGALQQFSMEMDDTALLNKDGKKFFQQVTGTFLYYAREVDSKMLVELSAIWSEKSGPTENTMKNLYYSSITQLHRRRRS